MLLDALGTLADAQLMDALRTRGQVLAMHAALHRSLARISYHVGQIVYLAKSLPGGRRTYLSIPPGDSAAYNRNPTNEHAHTHACRLRPKQDRQA